MISFLRLLGRKSHSRERPRHGAGEEGEGSWGEPAAAREGQTPRGRCGFTQRRRRTGVVSKEGASSSDARDEASRGCEAETRSLRAAKTPKHTNAHVPNNGSDAADLF